VDPPEGNETRFQPKFGELKGGLAYINFHTTIWPASPGQFPGDGGFPHFTHRGLNAATELAPQYLRKVASIHSWPARGQHAFVLMEYFGYLRRDADTSGYNFWLRKLNEFNGKLR